MNIAILGTGFVSQAYMRALHYLGYHPLSVSRAWNNYYDASELAFLIKSQDTDFLINCAGYTGDTVDDCSRNPVTCFAANAELPATIARVCARAGVRVIHISSGCIFNGTSSAFSETDEPNFIKNAYQRAKYQAEESMRGCDSWIFRIRMPFSQFPHPRNWLTKLIRYPNILTGYNSVTWIDEFAMRSWQLAQKAPKGIYHAAQRGGIYTHHVADMLHDAGLRGGYELINEQEFLLSGRVKRSEAVLNVEKFEKAYGTPFTPTVSALDYCIGQMSRWVSLSSSVSLRMENPQAFAVASA